MSSANIKFIISVLLYGTIGMVLRYITVPSEIVVLFRGIIGTITILIIGTLMGHKLDKEAIKHNIKHLIPSGICLGLNWVFLFAAYRATSVAIASLCNYTAPIMILILTMILTKERPTVRKIVCIICAAVGITMVSGVIGGGESFNAKGVLLGFASALGFVGIVMFNRRLENIDAIDKSVIQLSISAAVVLPYAVAMNISKPVDVNLRSVLLIAMLGILQTGVAYIFYFDGLAKISLESIAVLGYIEPVFSIILSVAVLREKMGIIAGCGAVLLLGAALYNELSEAKDQSKKV